MQGLLSAYAMDETGERMDVDREQRKQALRERVKKQLNQNDNEQEIVVSSDELIVHDSETANHSHQIYSFVKEDSNRVQSVASMCILLGSILGVISGILIFQGNPGDLLASSFFSETDTVDVTGVVLFDDDGGGLVDVLVELQNEDGVTVQSTTSNSDGYYRFENVTTSTHILSFSKEGYQSIERTFDPDGGTSLPATMSEGDGIVSEDFRTNQDGWSLDLAVGLSSIIGIVTISCGFIGIQGAVEVRRARHYRRSHYLSGIGLFSRGLIIFGPLLILLGMILITFIRDEFEDQTGA